MRPSEVPDSSDGQRGRLGDEPTFDRFCRKWTGQIAGASDASTEHGFMTGQPESSPLAIDLKQVVLADREVIPGGLRIERN